MLSGHFFFFIFFVLFFVSLIYIPWAWEEEIFTLYQNLVFFPFVIVYLYLKLL